MQKGRKIVAKNEAKIKISADIKELKQEVNNANSHIKALRSELRLGEAQFKNTGDKTEYLKNKHQILSSMLVENSNKQEALNKQLVLAQKAGDTAQIEKLNVTLNYAKVQEENLKAQISECNTELERQKQAEAELQSPLGKINSAIEKQKSELDGLKHQYKNVALEQGTNSKEAQELKSKIDSLNSELQENKEKLKTVENAVNSVDKEMEDATESADNMGDGYTVLKDVMANLATNGIEKASESFKELATQGEASLDKLKAKVGASEDDMKMYSDVVNDVYRNGFGESIDDVTEAIGTIVNMTGELDKQSLNNITENAMTLSDIYDMEITESMRAVNSLMKQFGIDADQAFNLIVQGVQNGLDQNGDLLDTINEYSVHFSAAGYTANDMFNMLVNGAETGTWSIDKLGDAVKEYNIRMSDGTADEALTALGLNAKKVTSEFAKGGESAKNATQKIIQALMDCKDPQKQYLLGQQIMGTMWEDLGVDAVKSLMDINGEIEKSKDAIGNVKTDAYDNLDTSISELGRTLETDLIQPAANEAVPVLQDVIRILSDAFKWTTRHKTLMGVLAGTIAAVTAAIGLYCAAKAVGIAMKNAEAASLGILIAAKWKEVSANLAAASTGMAAIAPYLGIAAAIAIVITAIVLCVKHWDKIKNKITEVANTIKKKVSEMKESVAEKFQEIKNNISEKFESIKNVISFAFQLIANIISAAFQIITLPFRFIWENCKEYVFAVFNAIREFINNAINKIKEIITTVLNSIKTVWNTVWTAVKNILMPIINSIKSFISTAFNTIKNVITNIINSVKNTVANVFNAIKNTISGPLNAVKSTVSNIFDAIRNKIDSVITKAKDIVQKGVNAIKGFFDKLKIKFPNIKLPHFKIDGEFSLKPPKVPKLSIDWYAKGAVFSRPTLLSYVNGIAGVGEAGPEAVAPISVLKKYIQEAVNVSMSTMVIIDYVQLARAMAQLKTTIELDNREVGRVVRGYK